MTPPRYKNQTSDYEESRSPRNGPRSTKHAEWLGNWRWRTTTFLNLSQMETKKTGLKQPGEPAKNDDVAPPDASLSASQRLRLQEARARAEQASARVGGLNFAQGVLNEEVLDDDGAGTDASGIPGMKTSSLSKKEKEKAKKLRAKDRAATESAKKTNEENPPPGIEPGTKPTLPEPQTNDLKGNTKGSKAAALLAKAKQSQSAKRNEAALAAERRNACLDAAQKRTAAVVGATHRGAFAGGGGGSIAGG